MASRRKKFAAEIDYVIQHRNGVIPIEVKTGSTGSLKSLHLFMGLKRFPVAVRVNSDFPSKNDINVKDHQGNSIKYTLLSLPFYLLGQLHHFFWIMRCSVDFRGNFGITSKARKFVIRPLFKTR